LQGSSNASCDPIDGSWFDISCSEPGGIDGAKRGGMSHTVRMRVLIPALLILLAFLIGFRVWVHSPHSLGGRIFAYVFGTIAAVLFVVGVIGKIGFLVFGNEIFRDWKSKL
jgi:hypothetical protein